MKNLASSLEIKQIKDIQALILIFPKQTHVDVVVNKPCDSKNKMLQPMAIKDQKFEFCYSRNNWFTIKAANKTFYQRLQQMPKRLDRLQSSQQPPRLQKTTLDKER